MASRKSRRTRRNNAERFRGSLTRGIGKRNLTKNITIKGRNQRGYNLTGILNNPNLGPNNISHMNTLVESRRGNSRRTPAVVRNVGLNPEESRKYAELYHNYVLNNSANADEKFIYAIDEDDSVSKNTKIKFVKHFLASLEAGSELNRKAGKNAISEIYNRVNNI